VVEKGLESDYPSRITSAFGDFPSPRGCPPVVMQMRGLAIFGQALGLLGTFATANEFHRVLRFRDWFYGTPAITELGVRRTRPFIGHITVAYIERSLALDERRRLASSVDGINQALGAEPPRVPPGARRTTCVLSPGRVPRPCGAAGGQTLTHALHRRISPGTSRLAPREAAQRNTPCASDCNHPPQRTRRVDGHRPQCSVSESSIGDYSYLAGHVSMVWTDMGKFCSIAAQTRINPGNHPTWRVTQHQRDLPAHPYGFDTVEDADFFRWRSDHRCTIGHDVWIGHGVTVIAGRKIGIGAVIGSGAVVTRDIPPYAIAVGVPARVVKFRFPPDVVEKLLATQWWDWDRATLEERFKDLLDPEVFLRKYGDTPAPHSAPAPTPE
jgi:phosphonate metabolism protein (transferase hexapeptide repeat family)